MANNSNFCLIYNSNICRLCATTSSNMYALFKNYRDENLASKINKYLPVKVIDDGKSPRWLCSGCHIQLEATEEFFELILKGQSELNNLLIKEIKSIQNAVNISESILNSNVFIDFDLTDNSFAEEETPYIEVKNDNETTHEKRLTHKTSCYVDSDKSELQESYLYFNEVIASMEDEDGTHLGHVVRMDSELDAVNKPVIRFVCEICKETFARKTPFLLHRYSHSTVRYECSQCFKSFEILDHFYQHQELSNHKDFGIIEYFSDNENSLKTDDDHICDMESLHNWNNLNLLATNEQFSNSLSDSTSSLLLTSTNSFSNDSILDNDNIEEHAAKVLKELQESNENLIKSEFDSIVPDFFEINEPKQKPDLLEMCEELNMKNNSKPLARFRCSHCPKVFDSKRKIDIHRIVHISQRQFVCQQCGIGCKNKRELYCHQSKHKEKKYNCDLCGTKCASKQRLRTHLMIHNGERPHQCELCHKTFTQRFNLTEHMRIHTGERPFSCDQCKAKFKTSSQLRCHKLRHSQMNYKCDICNKMFYIQSDLNIHIRRHKSNKPYQCELCPMKFVERNALKKHSRNHTGEKPFSCTECYRTFADRSNFRKHMKIHERHKSSKIFEIDAGINLNVNVDNCSENSPLVLKTIDANPDDVVNHEIFNLEGQSNFPTEDSFNAQSNIDFKLKNNENSANIIQPIIDINYRNVNICQQGNFVLPSVNISEQFYSEESTNIYFIQ